MPAFLKKVAETDPAEELAIRALLAEDVAEENLKKTATIISPDEYLLTSTGEYAWSEERVQAAWWQSKSVLDQLVRTGRYNRVVMLVGLPASGKTSWLRANHEPDTIYFDATLTKARERATVIQRAKDNNLEVWAVVMDTPIAICIDRNLCRTTDRIVPVGAFERMQAQLAATPVTEAEGIDRIIHVRGVHGATALPSGWKQTPATGSYTIFESKDGNVRVQDTRRPGHPARYQVIYRPVKEMTMSRGKVVENTRHAPGQWLEVDNKSSLAAAFALGVSTEKNMQGKTAGFTIGEKLQRLQERRGEDAQGNLTHLPNPYGSFCPVCSTPAVRSCRCSTSEKTCNQGHTWVTCPVDKNRIVPAKDTHSSGAFQPGACWCSNGQVYPPSPKLGKTAKSNAKVVEVPASFSPVVLEKPQAKRKEFPFEGFIDFQGLKIDVENAKGSTRSGEGPEGPWSTSVHRVARRYMVAKGFDVPFSTSTVTVEPPRKKRKEYPFEGFIHFQGLNIHVENVKGSTREGVDPDGTPWKVVMKHHYGEVDQTEGVDHDPVDIYVGPNGDSPLVVVVRQQDPKTKKYDEDKVMVGFNTEEDAVAAYKAQYNSAGFYQSHKSMPIGRFLRWCLDKENRGKKVSRLSGGSCSGRAG